MIEYTQRTFDIKDAFNINLREQEARSLNRHWLVQMSKLGGTMTILADGIIIAILGYFEKWPGVIQVYVVPSIYVRQHPKHFLKTVKLYLDRLANDFGYHRMQTESLSDDSTDKWMHILGFTCEGLLSQFSSTKEDYKMWARVS